MPSVQDPTAFNEDTLRAAIADRWGEHGAHVEVFDHILKLARTCDLDGLLATEALRRLLASNIPHGHKANPITRQEDRDVIDRANTVEPLYHRSRLCWDCDASGDKAIYSPESDRTWGDEWHEQYEAYAAARKVLAEIDNA